MYYAGHVYSPMPASDELLSLLARRSGFVECLVEGGLERRDLVDELELSRSAVYKGVKELEETGLVEDSGEGLVPTAYGKAVFDVYVDAEDRLDEVIGLRRLLRTLPRDVEVPFELLEEGEVVLPERSAPHAPLKRFEELVEGADSVKGLSPVVLPDYVELFHGLLSRNGAEVSLILERGVVEHLASTYSEELNDGLSSSGFELYIEEELPFGLVVVDEEEIGLVIYDSKGGNEGSGYR